MVFYIFLDIFLLFILRLNVLKCNEIIIIEFFVIKYLDEYFNISLYLYGENGLMYEIYYFFSLIVRILKYF